MESKMQSKMVSKKKRLLSVVLAFMLAFGMMPVQGAASPMEVTFVDAPDQADAYTTTPGALAVPVTVAAFDEICEWTLFQGYDFGKITEEELDLPTVLTGTCVDGYAVTIAGVTWQSNPPFDPWYSAMYMFASVLPMGYELAEGVNPPVISVLIRPEDGIDIDALTSAANLASQINNFQHGGMGFLDASRFGNVIYVEGHVTGTTGDMRFNDHRRSLNLDIRPGVIVVWLAHFEGVSSVAGGMTHPLIRLTGPGGGELIMQDDAAIIATQRQAIVIDRGSTTTLRAEGNSLIQGDSIAVWAHNGYAHVILAESARVQSNITGLQAIRNLSVYDNASIIATQPIVNTTAGAAGPANIHISGGTITATSNRPAILMRPSQTNLVISGGTIYAPNPGTATIETSASTVEISGNAHISSGNGTALETFASTIEINMTAGQSRTLTGTVAPANATNQTITWSIQNAGTTGATISGNTLTTTAAGTVTILATITNGETATTNFTQTFTITVTAAALPPALPPQGGGSGGGGSRPRPRPAPRSTSRSTPAPTPQLEIELDVEPVTDAPAPALNEEPEGFDIENINTYRLVAVSPDGVILGGRFDRETGAFVFETNRFDEMYPQGVFTNGDLTSGAFTIEYVETLNRFHLQIGAFTITDMAGNAPTQTMDVVPVIVDGRTLLPIRFVAYALGADVDWTAATADRPLTVHLTLNGRTLDLAIGEITPELAALGMDVPAQIINDRTMVPPRFVSEFSGAVVTWDEATRTVEIIFNPTNPMPRPTVPLTNNPNLSVTAYIDRSAKEAIERALAVSDDE